MSMRTTTHYGTRRNVKRQIVKRRVKQNKDQEQVIASDLTLAKSTVKKTTTPSLENVKQVMRKRNNGESMKVGQFYYCDHCSSPIYDSTNGVIIHGNIYIADPTMRGGLVGNNFPDVKPGTKIEVTDVKETVMCMGCLSKILDEPSIKVEKPYIKEDDDFIKELRKITLADDDPF